MPAERLISHQAWSVALMPKHRGVDVAVVADRDPAVPAQPAAAPAGPLSSAALASASASSAVGASAVAPISPVHAGSPVAGSRR